MTTRNAETARTARTDEDAIRTLISRFTRALDERKFDDDGWIGPYCTEDVRMVSPLEVTEGAATRKQMEEALGRYARTQHMTTDLVVDVTPGAGRATASWNALMTHIHHEETLRRRGEGANPVLMVGGYWRAELIRTPAGRRMTQVSVDAVWTAGDPPDFT
ncbi:nuclear transport factor 2 family protein [Streptomyces sp. URMC 129]|uniref:nuclear transport factor 2 family protein n=1 Tax=Streptomyces sp. URMC 129 TaxID=3423407 RepID=UPI003F1E1AD1